MGTNQERYLIIRADAGSRMGTGHVMRCLALAQAWQHDGGHAIILSNCEGDTLNKQITNGGIKFVSIPSPYPDPRDLTTTLEILQRCSTKTMGNPIWLVLDGYHFDTDYQRAVRTPYSRLLVIDDTAHLPVYHADILFNQNLGAENLKYHHDPGTILLLGSRYVLLRQEFLAWRGWKPKIPEVAHKLLITMGGSDPNNVTLKVLQALDQLLLNGLEVIVVVGGNNPHYESLVSTIQNLKFKICLERNATNMSDLMAWADLAVTAGGSTCWELAFMGVPSLVISTAENQFDVVHYLQMLGLAIHLGWHQQVTQSQIAKSLKHLAMSREMRRSISQQCQARIDGDGGDRLLLQIHSNRLKLRRVTEEDKLLLWEWANAPDVRAASFSTETIPWEQHVRWFAAKQKDPDCIFYLALSETDVPLGQVRFDVDGKEATISISLDAKHRGHGYGSQLIILAAQKLFRISQVQLVHAYVKEGNQASIHAFRKAGFLENKIVFMHGQEARHFILSRLRKA